MSLPCDGKLMHLPARHLDDVPIDCRRHRAKLKLLDGREKGTRKRGAEPSCLIGTHIPPRHFPSPHASSVLFHCILMGVGLGKRVAALPIVAKRRRFILPAMPGTAKR